ncbi:hypothetical protein YC2023_055643 [Brassica napus]
MEMVRPCGLDFERGGLLSSFFRMPFSLPRLLIVERYVVAQKVHHTVIFITLGKLTLMFITQLA